MSRRVTGWIVAVLIAANCLGEAQAAPPTAAVENEVNHLLEYVSHSGCDFYRNGTWYESKRAADHLRSKYEYLLKRDQIATTEDFIQKVASVSSMSSQPYKVRCQAQPERPAGPWLVEELAAFRAVSAD
jgi:Family of unknown function (DUF5329)